MEDGKPVVAPKVKRNRTSFKHPEVDYDKLATMVSAKLAPIFIKSGKEVDSREMETGQIDDIVLKDGTVAIGGAALQAVDGALNKSYLDELAFMEEEIEIMLAETDDVNAENPVTVGNNGIFATFFRGHPTRTRRKFVDCLIVKSARISTPEVQNGAGERARAIRQTNAHKYPFTIISDRNPKGTEWLRRRMAESI